MMENIKAFLLDKIITSLQRTQTLTLPWWWNFLPRSWKKEFSELILVALPILHETTYRQSETHWSRVLVQSIASVLCVILLVVTVNVELPTSQSPKAMAIQSNSGKPLSPQQRYDIFLSDKAFYATGMGVGEPAYINVPLYNISSTGTSISAFIEGIGGIPIGSNEHTAMWISEEQPLLNLIENRSLVMGWTFEVTSTTITGTLATQLENYHMSRPVLITVQNN